MVTCQSANQLKTPAKVSWAFKMVSQFGSLGYTLMEKTADLTVVQKTIIDTLHKEGKTQTFITKEAVHRVLYQSMLTESWVKEKVWKKKMHNQLREPQSYEDCQEESIQEFKNVYQATSLQSQYTFTQLLSKVFLNKYNKTFSCDLTWSIVTRCIMKKNWTCSAAALELILTSCYIRQYMRLIVHFYSKLTLNHHRVFVITFFCDHMCLYTLWAAVVHYKSSLNPTTHGSVLFPATGSSTQPNCGGKPQHWFAVPLSHMSMHKVYLKQVMPLGHPSAAPITLYGETSNSTKRFTKLTIKFPIWNHQWNRTTTVSYMLFLLLKLRYKKLIFQARSASAHAQSWARVSEGWLFL